MDKLFLTKDFQPHDMKRFLTTLSFLFCLSAGLTLYADNSAVHIPIHQISTDNGLSHTTVNAIYRDEFGFVWIGTTDGLNRYDGHSITTYRYDSADDRSIKANNISQICGNRNGHIYIKGQNSLIVYDQRKEEFKTIHEDGITAITYHDGLYYATGNSIYRIDAAGKEECIHTHLCQGTCNITQIRFDSNGNLSFSTSSDEIVRTTSDNRTRRFRIENFYALDSDDFGNIWISTRTSGFARIDAGGNLQKFVFEGNSRQASDRNNVRSIIHAYGNKYYIGTYDGLILYDAVTHENSALTYDLRKGFENHAVRTLHRDGNILFIGTFHAGLQYYNMDEGFQQTFAPAFQHGALTSPIISAVCKDVRGILWIGSISGGLSVIDPEKKINGILQKRIRSCKALYNVKSMYYDPEEDVLWIATFSEGIVRIGISQNTFDEIPLQNPIQNIVKILSLDERSLILCSTIDGLYRLDRQTMKITSLQKKLGLSNIGIINDIAVDAGTLWLCTDHQILKVDIEKGSITSRYSTSSFHGMLAEHTTRCLYCDRSGKLWAGTSGAGIFAYDQKSDSFVNCTSGKHQGNNFINNITEGYISDDRLYFATNDGISILHRDTQHFDIVNRNSILPLSITDFIYISEDSTIYCSGMQGLYAAKENILSDQADKTQRFKITGLRINNQKVHPGSSETSLLSESVLYQNSITLQHTNSSVAFDIANCNLDPSGNLGFEYRLEGFDQEFIKPYSNTVSYTNLTPGNYTLYIKANGSDDIIDRMELCILPPFYARWWFIMCVILLVGTIAYFIGTYYVNRRQMSRKLREAQRENEVTQAKVEFFANVSHEFRTPLTLINSYLEVMLQSGGISPENYRNINGALANTTKLKDMINEFIDASRTDGQLRLNMTYSFIKPFVYEYYTVFSDYAQQKDITLEFDCKVDDMTQIAFDRIHIGRALSNLISNAFKYTGPKGKIGFEIHQDDEFVHICVHDSGKGIKKENLNNVFERFWQDKEANDGLLMKGSGIGLSYVKSIVEMHNGKVDVSSIPDVSTKFTISLHVCNSLCAYVPPFSNVLDNVDVLDSIAEADACDGVRNNLLIIEDNTELRSLLQRIFSRRYNVYVAGDGADALALVEQTPVDLVLSDVMMPNMSGIEFCNILKSQPSTSHIPVVLLTALNAEGSIIKGLNTGADDYITKPFSAKILLAKCQNILNVRKQLQEKYQSSAKPDINILTESTIDNDILHKAIQIIESNISAPAFDIIDFAQELGLSRTSLFNKIKGITGMTPNNFMIDIKLKHAARKLLEKGDNNISDIAYACGFNTLSHFNKLFKKTYGMTPSEYRNTSKS